MNWKTEALDKLNRYDAMRQAQQNIPREIKRLELAARSLTAALTDKAPVKGGGSRQEDALLDNIVCRQELLRSLEQAQLWVQCAEDALRVLTPEERLILSRMYIFRERDALQRLCGELGMEKSSLYRKRDKALRRFTLAFYGTMES